MHGCIVLLYIPFYLMRSFRTIPMRPKFSDYLCIARGVSKGCCCEDLLIIDMFVSTYNIYIQYILDYVTLA